MYSVIDQQELIEKQYSRKHIDGYIREAITTNPVMQEKIRAGIQLVLEYMGKHYTYTTKDGVVKDFESKNRRVKQLANLDIPQLVLDIFVGVAYCQREELFTSVTAQMASRLKFSDKKDAITTVAELMAVLCMTDAFDILKGNKMASLVVKSNIPLSDELIRFIDNSQYLPPMICEPKELLSNYSSGYLTHNDSLILGSGNHHDGDICLDVLNLMNKVQLSLDTQFLSSVEEMPTFDLDDQRKCEQWSEFKRQSYEFYLLIAKANNQFYLTHKVDKRGRIYASGYHITTQGTAFKKACIELAHQEVISGVPDDLRLP